MRAAAAWLLAAVLLAAAGCGGHGSADHSDPAHRSGGQVAQECSHHVDALIDARVVPRSDRDYATEMCLQNR